jgi:tRNA (cmo5U34)-methyltransferase
MEWSDPDRVAEYLSRQIPHRQTAEVMLLQALPKQVGRVLDLGTGDGRLVSLIRSAHPGADAIGLDSSEPMLARARERFDGDTGIEFRLHDLRDPLPQVDRFDAVVSALAIHHLEDDPSDRLAGLCDQLDWLRAAGLADADCHFKWMQLTLMVGTAA